MAQLSGDQVTWLSYFDQADACLNLRQEHGILYACDTIVFFICFLFGVLKHCSRMEKFKVDVFNLIHLDFSQSVLRLGKVILHWFLRKVSFVVLFVDDVWVKHLNDGLQDFLWSKGKLCV